MKVGFTGAYCTANFGDWSILVNNILDINATENIVFTYSDSFPHKAVNHYCSGHNINFVEVKTLSETTFSHAITPFECIQMIDNISELEKEIADLDVLCVSGGGYLDDNWCSRTTKFAKIVAPIIIATNLGQKVVFMAQGVGPIESTKETLRLFFNYLENPTIAVRDNYCSSSYLNDLGIMNNIYHLPDDLLFINDALISNKKLCNENYIVIVLHDTMDYIKENYMLFVNFATEIKNKYDLNIVFLPFDLVWYGYDQSLFLTEKIESAKITPYNKFLPIEEAYNCIMNAKLVLTARYHATILAQQLKTPFILKLNISSNGRVYSYNKTHGAIKNIFSGIRCNESCFFSSDWKSCLDYVSNNFYDIVNYQQELYNNDIVEVNLATMKKKRLQYIERFLKG